MTLSFTQTINGKPNYFPQKIWMSLPEDIRVNFVDVCYTPYFNKYGKTIDMMNDPKPKLHTIRHDEKCRWKAGKLIHPVVKPEGRFSAGFQFAPTIPCKSVQRIDIKDVSHLVGTKEDKWIVLGYPVKDVIFNLAFEVKVDGRVMDETIVEQIAVNDGFDSTRDFLNYFQNGIDNGKLIHWRDLKY